MNYLLSWKVEEFNRQNVLVLFKGWQQKTAVPAKNQRRLRTVSSPPPPRDNFIRHPVPKPPAPAPKPKPPPPPPPPPSALT
nr:hypothetical protein [Tanacetum cinerariifolium]